MCEARIRSPTYKCDCWCALCKNNENCRKLPWSISWVCGSAGHRHILLDRLTESERHFLGPISFSSYTYAMCTQLCLNYFSFSHEINRSICPRMWKIPNNPCMSNVPFADHKFYSLIAQTRIILKGCYTILDQTTCTRKNTTIWKQNHLSWENHHSENCKTFPVFPSIHCAS